MEQSAPVFNPLASNAANTPANKDKPPRNQARQYDYFYIQGVIEKRSKNAIDEFPVVNSPVKIGFSKNPWARIADLKKTVHPDIELLAYVRVRPNSRSKIAPYFRKAGKKRNWYFMDENVKSLIKQIKDETFTGLDNWPAPPVYRKWLRETGDKAGSKKKASKIPTNGIHPNNINNNNQIMDKTQSKQEECEATKEISMTLEWEPSINLTWLLDRNGLPPLDPLKKIEFILYWMRRGDIKRTQIHWENTLVKDLRAEDEKRKKAQRREAAAIERLAQIKAKVNLGYSSHSKTYYGHSQAPTNLPWSAAFKEFEKKRPGVVTEETRRGTQQAQADSMAQVWASLGKRPKVAV